MSEGSVDVYDIMESMERIELNRVYRHFKGDQYLVEDMAKHSESGEDLVIYRALYGDGQLYARPAKMFLEELSAEKAAQYGQKRRFELVEVKSKRG